MITGCFLAQESMAGGGRQPLKKATSSRSARISIDAGRLHVLVAVVLSLCTIARPCRRADAVPLAGSFDVDEACLKLDSNAVYY